MVRRLIPRLIVTILLDFPPAITHSDSELKKLIFADGEPARPLSYLFSAKYRHRQTIFPEPKLAF
jgi:hypothetical protein